MNPSECPNDFPRKKGIFGPPLQKEMYLGTMKGSFDIICRAEGWEALICGGGGGLDCKGGVGKDLQGRVSGRICNVGTVGVAFKGKRNPSRNYCPGWTRVRAALRALFMHRSLANSLPTPLQSLKASAQGFPTLQHVRRALRSPQPPSLGMQKHEAHNVDIRIPPQRQTTVLPKYKLITGSENFETFTVKFLGLTNTKRSPS